MQCAVIEFARHVLGWEDAHSAEFDEFTKHPVIDIMPEQKSVTQKGGTMRLGAYPCVLSEGSRAAALYGKTEISRSVTATAMNSATTSAMRSSLPDWFRPDCPRTDGS